MKFKIMKKNRVFEVMLLFCLFFGIFIFPHSIRAVASEPKLTIYTYESLLADPGYDFIEGYSNYSGIPKDQIQLVALEDANSLITRLLGEKESPVADVVIGLDNSLIFEAKRYNLLKPYSSPLIENISSSLINNLDPDHYLLPYDYGIIAFNYDQLRVNTTTVPDLENLTLNKILDLDLAKKIVVEDPTLSSPGLGFLLWTIAVFGDPSINFTGILGDDWRNWWKSAAEDLRIANSWGAAFDIYDEPNENRPIMLSYGTSPAYTVCQGWGDNLKAFLSHENGTSNAWLQIEGIGLVNGASHTIEGQHFIDWFLGEELQSQIAENNWMYPANQQVQVSSCFNSAAINPDDVNILNNLITTSMLESNLAKWKQDWEETMVMKSPGISGFQNPFLFVFAISFSLGVILLLQQRKIFQLRKNVSPA